MDIMEITDQEIPARPHHCTWNQCRKAFSRRSDLDRHYRIHTNERPYKCEFRDCGKSFIQQSALTVHKRTHTGEKPHVCTVDGCGKRFSDSSSLARHRRSHTGRRPYACDRPGCGKTFCRRTTMIKHQRRPHPIGGTGAETPDGGSEVDTMYSPPTPTHTPYAGKWVPHVFTGGSSQPQQPDQKRVRVGSPNGVEAQRPRGLIIPEEYCPPVSDREAGPVRHDFSSSGSSQLNNPASLPNPSLNQPRTVGSPYASSVAGSDHETSSMYGVKRGTYDAHSPYQSPEGAPRHPVLASQGHVLLHPEPMPVHPGPGQSMYLPVQPMQWYGYPPQSMVPTIQHPIQGSFAQSFYSFMQPKLEYIGDPSMQLPSMRLNSD